MPELPPTNPRTPTDPDEPGGTGRHEGTPTPIQPPGGFTDIEAGVVVAGRYKLVRELGAGGMGAVWMAEQSEPVRRLVAVKLIRTGMDSQEFLGRFEAERQALSLMDHPNIARVFDAGTHQGRPFFVMELVKGTPITKFCDEKRLTPRQRLELFIPVCNAIQHAHQKGIIHRDIKPTNVLVAVHDDKPVPKVIDFGVAKATGQPLSEKTMHTLGIVGTPEYMSPEQATENQLDIDTRSDVYSLGVLLYELLTGTTPVKAAGLKQKVLLEILRIVREVDAPRPSTFLSTSDTSPGIAAVRGTEPARLAKELRGELDWIALKALEKDRARRYETANGFAADVQRYLAGEPVLAHPPSATYRMRKFVRKNRVPVVATSLILLALIGGAVGTVYGVIKADGERTANSLRLQAEGDRDVAEAAKASEKIARSIAETAQAKAEIARDREKSARKEVVFLHYVHAVDLAFREWKENNIRRAREILDDCPRELRNWEWHYVHRLCYADLFTLTDSGGFHSAMFNTEGTRILAGGNRSSFVWEADTGALIHSFGGSAVSPTFSQDGKRIVTGLGDSTARVWDAIKTSGAGLFLLKGHSGRIMSASFNPDGTRIITASLDKSAKIWDAATGRELLTLGGHTNGLMSARFSPDGTRAVTGSYDSTARIWNASTGAEILKLKHDDFVLSASYSPDGAQVVTGCMDKTAKVWDAKTGAKLLTLNGHLGGVGSASFSRDGRRIVTGGGSTATVWDAKTGESLLTCKGHVGFIASASFNADGSRIVSVGDDKTARVWDGMISAEHLPLKGHLSQVVSAAFSTDGTKVITGSTDNTAKVWDARTGAILLTLRGHSDVVTSATFSWDGTLILTGGDKTAKIWNASTGVEIQSFKGQNNVTSVSFRPDGARIVTGSDDNTAKVWDAKTGTELHTLRHTNQIRSVAYSRDGKRIVTAGNSGHAKVWDADTAAEIRSFEGHISISTASFSYDGMRIVTGGADRTAKVWNIETGDVVTLKGHAYEVTSAAFSPDGTRVVTASLDKTAKLWDATTGAELLTLKGHADAVMTAAFSSDGSRILTGSYDNTALIWDSRPINLKFLPRETAHPPRASGR